VAHPCTNGVHHSGDFPTRHVGQRRFDLVTALHNQAIHEAKRGCVDADANLTGQRSRHILFDQPDRARSAQPRLSTLPIDGLSVNMQPTALSEQRQVVSVRSSFWLGC
jgi:hypothetical protein